MERLRVSDTCGRRRHHWQPFLGDAAWHVCQTSWPICSFRISRTQVTALGFWSSSHVSFWGAANHLGLNLLVGQLTALSPNERGTILGLYSAVTYAAMFTGTAAFNPIFEQRGFSAAALLSAACIAPALLHSIRRHRKAAPKAELGRSAQNGR